MFKIDIVCIGAQKAMTTAVFNYLKMQESLFNLPNEKECHFFEIDERYKQGLSYLQNKFYPGWNPSKPTILINPNLSLDSIYLERILKHNPRIKILYILRDPVSRAYSHYKMSTYRGIENLKFKDALAQERRRLINPQKQLTYKTQILGHYERNHFGYRFRSNYSLVINFLRRSMNANQYAVLFYEELVDNPKKLTSFFSEKCGIIIPQIVQINSANSSRKSRFKFLTKVLFDKKRKRFVLIRFIPASLKVKLKRLLINWSTVEEMDELTKKTKDLIFSEYFRDDYLNLPQDLLKEAKLYWDYD